jgi:amidophosphoribosyltransferase
VRASIGADTLGYLTKDGMIAATGQEESKLCTACFTGKYPIELPLAERLGKNLLERPAGSASDDADPAACNPGPDSELDAIVRDAEAN